MYNPKEFYEFVVKKFTKETAESRGQIDQVNVNIHNVYFIVYIL